MFCPACGAQLPDGAAFCPSCGNPVAAKGQQPGAGAVGGAAVGGAAFGAGAAGAQQAQPFQQTQQQGYAQQPGAQPAYGQAALDAHPEYQTIGGWLLFFVIVNILSVISLIGTGLSGINGETLEMVRHYLNDGVANTMLFNALFSLAMAAGYIVFIVFIFKKNQNFLKLYQILGIASIVISIIMVVMMNASMSEAVTSLNLDTTSGIVSSIVSGVVGLVLMTLYYCKSVRVRTYMGGTDYQQKALFRIGA